jgi:hypothetical protein
MSDPILHRDPDDGLDSLLRHELRWEVPPELTARLLLMIPGSAPLALVRPKTWYSGLVAVLTAVAIGLSLAVAWQVYSAVGAELGLAAIFEQLRYAPAIGLQRLYQALPASRQAVALLEVVRAQIHWLLLAVVLWLALDGWQPRLRASAAGR